ncbi:MAG: dihydropteroate synthase [Bacteroidales bacterium]|jgi:dihydropteroate synthase|nr:dihydropteroate synthase [Bacteroidales bacterium]
MITFNCNGKLVTLEQPIVMGILNITPDSFYDGGKYRSETEVIARCAAMLEEGATIIDVGAVSTRPGSAQATAAEEEQRLTDALSAIRKEFPDVLLSLDTYRADIARKMVHLFGVDIINDISAGTIDGTMFETVASLNVPYILMHIQGTPENMQNHPTYNHLMGEVIAFFREKMTRLRSLGVKDIILDPGFGFGKTMEHNYELLNQLQQLDIFDCAVLAAASRKSMIYKLLDIDPTQALNGTTVINTLALLNGADILRVHDVKEAVECIRIFQKYKKTPPLTAR